MRRSLTLPSVLFFLAGSLAAAPKAAAPDTIVQEYVALSQQQKSRLAGASMEVDIAADVPRLRKKGRLHAFRKISAVGRVTYEMLGFEGDRSIRSDVIARYLKAETQAGEKDGEDLAVTPKNYKFRYKGTSEWLGRQVHVFELSPRKKRVGLYQGQLWIDAATSLPVREFGRFVKNPSVFLRRVEFVREYELVDGVAVPRVIRSSIDTRIVGKAHLSVVFNTVSLDGAPVKISLAGGL